MLISIVIPCYRSEQTLPNVVNEVRNEFEKHPEHTYQFVLVNDCSPDNGATWRTILRLCNEDPNITGVDLSRNFGQARARVAALPYIKGDCAVYMDDDGQHPADGIFLLVDKLQEGYDGVYATLHEKQCSWFRRNSSRAMSWVAEKLGVRPKGLYYSAFFVWSRFAIDALKDYHSPMPSVFSYLQTVTTRSSNVEIAQRARMAGHSGYTLRKLFSLAIMDLTNFSMVPLRLAAVLGSATAGVGFLFGAVLVIRKLINPAIVMGYTSTMAVMLLLGGIIMMLLGLIGEYLGRIYMVISDLPQYRVRETKNTDDDLTICESRPLVISTSKL